jgi:mRNA-degrading endonuclease RelE of RelBE toxin-antitoxin system
MVDRIEKALRKLGAKERRELADIIQRLLRGDFSSLDIKKLQGFPDAYRVRKGDMRIIFYMTNRANIRIIAVERRSDTTYRD